MFGRNAFVGIVAGAMVLWMNGIDDGRAAARVGMSCDGTAPMTVTVTIHWRPPDAGATETWLAVGVAPEFVPGTYQAFGPFGGEVRSHIVAAAVEGIRYRYRINARHADSWHEVAAGLFVATCPPPAT